MAGDLSRVQAPYLHLGRSSCWTWRRFRTFARVPATATVTKTASGAGRRRLAAKLGHGIR